MALYNERKRPQYKKKSPKIEQGRRGTEIPSLARDKRKDRGKKEENTFGQAGRVKFVRESRLEGRRSSKSVRGRQGKGRVEKLAGQFRWYSFPQDR